MATPRANDRTHGHMMRETGTESPHIERELLLRTGTREYRVRFLCPGHIYRMVNSADRERERLYCEDLFQKMLLLAKVGGIRDAERICLEETLRTFLDRIYRCFVKVQWNEGNKSWMVPSTIQKNVLEEKT